MVTVASTVERLGESFEDEMSLMTQIVLVADAGDEVSPSGWKEIPYR
jgi:hypothetical protein